MPQVQAKSQQGSLEKRQSKVFEQIGSSVRSGIFLGFGLLFVEEIVFGILGNLISALWWIFALVFAFVFIGVSHLGMSKKIRRLSKVIVLIGFLSVLPLFTANLIVTYQNPAQTLSTPKETEYFCNVLGRNYNFTELYQWENSILHWNDSANMVFYSDPIQIYQYGQARCGGYAILYAELCISQGYEARIVVNVFGDHVWNEVKLNGAWTRVDASPTGADMSENIGFPLFYEKKWNAAPILALAFENSSITDVTGNYRSDGFSLLSGTTIVLSLVGVWLALCIFVIWRNRRYLYARKSVATKLSRLRQMRYKMFYKFKRMLFPITAFRFVILVGITLLAAFFLLPAYYRFNSDPNTASSLLVSYSQILTTIFALTISVTLIGVQYLAQMYTPRSVNDFFRDLFFAGFFVTYVFSITLNLFGASFPSIFSPPKLVFSSLLLLLFCLAYLVAFPFHVISKLQPTQVLRRINASIPKNLFQMISEHPSRLSESANPAKGPFVVLEQMIIRSIRNNDYDSYIQCLNCLTKTAFTLVDEAKNEYDKTKDLGTLARRTDDVVEFSYRLYDQIKIEVFQTKNEFFILSLLRRIEKFIEKLHDAKAIRSLEYVYRLYDGIGIFALNNDLEPIAEEYCKSMDRITKVEMKVNESELPPFDIDFGKRELTKRQREERTFNTIMFGYFEHGRLERLKETARIASDKGFKLVEFFVMNTYSNIFDRIIELRNIKLRGRLFQVVMWSLNEAYQSAAERGIHESSPLIGMVEYKIEKMRKFGVTANEMEYLVKSFCTLALLSIKKDDYGTIFYLGSKGRLMASENEPTFAIMLAETLGEALKIVRGGGNFKNITEEWIKEQLESIKKYNKSGNLQISSKIDELLSAAK